MCALRVSVLVQEKLHSAQTNGFSPLWTRIYGFSSWKLSCMRSRIGCNCIFSLHYDDYCRFWPSWKFQIFSSACAEGFGQLLKLKRTRSLLLYRMKVKVAPMKSHTNYREPVKYCFTEISCNYSDNRFGTLEYQKTSEWLTLLKWSQVVTGHFIDSPENDPPLSCKDSPKESPNKTTNI